MRNALGCCFSKEGAGPGCVGQAREEREGAERQSAMARVCHLPKRRWLGMGGEKKPRQPLMANTGVYLVLMQWMEEFNEKQKD